MPRKKKGGKKSGEQAGGDASTSRQETSGPSAPPQGAGDSQQTADKSQGTSSQQKTPPLDTPSQQQGQSAWQTTGKQQQSSVQQKVSPSEAHSQQQQQKLQGAWQKKGRQQQPTHEQQSHSSQEVLSQQTGPSAWQTRGRQSQPREQQSQPREQQSQPREQQSQPREPQRVTPQDTSSQQRTLPQGRSDWQTGSTQSQDQQRHATQEAPPQQAAPTVWQTRGNQSQPHTQQMVTPQDTRPQQGQWPARDKRPQQYEQQRPPQQRHAPQEAPPQQAAPAAWQKRGNQSQPHQQQRVTPQDTRQQGQWPARDNRQQPYEQQRPPQEGTYPQQTQVVSKPFGQQQRQSSTQSLVKVGANPVQEMQKLSLECIRGTKGRRIQVETNHLGIDFGKLEVAYHYDVQIIPDTPKRWLRDVFELFRKRHFPKNNPAFDGKRNMYSPYELVKSHEDLSDEIELSIPNETKTKTYKVTVKLATIVDLSPLRNMTMNSSQQALQCVEIVLRSAPSRRCIQAGRSFYTRPPSIIDLGEGCEMYYGHYQTVIRGWKPFFNVDVAHKAFPKEINVINLIAELSSDWRRTVEPRDLNNIELDSNVSTKLSKHLKGLRVSYEIPGIPSSKREYRVNGIEMSPRKKIFVVEDRKMSIEEYFQIKKKYKLYFPLMPTLWVGSVARADKILLPAELCTVVGGQAVNRKMTDNQTSAMIKKAATSTEVRKNKIMNSLRNTNHNGDLCIREFGFSINREFERIEARVLDPPALEYRDGISTRPSKGTWRQDNNKFYKGADLPSWIIISTVGNLAKECQNFATLVSNYGTKMGMRLAPKPGNFDYLQGRTTQKDVSNILQKYSKQFNLIFVIIPDSGPLYACVKKAAEITLNCLTQCLKKKTLMKMNPSTVGNILLKVNSKLNGTNHCLQTRPPILNEPCMIMGADVTHPSPDSKDIPSVVAVTASHDPRALFGYNMCCRLQLPTVEIIEDLLEITKEQLLFFFRKNNGQKPYRIIFLRDGVSEGQFAEVKQVELAAIRKACSAMQPGYEPKITFIVVQKRHHTRFFPQAKDSEDRNLNVPAGTCVDTVITSPNMQDFYLVSHASIQGVAKPTKYSTLWDDNNMSYDDVEQLAYYLCHLFSRCNRSVSYPAPTYYAHLGAARAKVYIESEPINLQNLKSEQRKLKNDVIRNEKPMFFV